MDRSYASYADWYLNGRLKDFVVEARMGGHQAPFHMVHARQPAGEVSDPALPEFILLTCLNAGYRGRMNIGCGPRMIEDRAGDTWLFPNDTATEIEVDGENELLILGIPPVIAALTSSPSGDSDFGALHESKFRDPTISRLLRTLWTEAAVGAPQGALFADSALRALTHWLRALSQGGACEIPANHALAADPRIARALQLLGDRLEDDLSLADAAGLSLYHFCRAFKAATGVTPHRYLMRLRVERAEDMLATTRVPVTEIAYACGFSSSQHMATAFRRVVGVTPTGYRRERLS